MRELVPRQFPLPASAPQPGGKAQAMRGEMGDNGQGGAMLREQVKDQTNRLADFVVRIEDDLARRVIDQAHWETHPEWALLRFGQLATEQALAQPVELGLTHSAHTPEQYPVVILP